MSTLSHREVIKSIIRAGVSSPENIDRCQERTVAEAIIRHEGRGAVIEMLYGNPNFEKVLNLMVGLLHHPYNAPHLELSLGRALTDCCEQLASSYIRGAFEDLRDEVAQEQAAGIINESADWDYAIRRERDITALVVGEMAQAAEIEAALVWSS